MAEVKKNILTEEGLKALESELQDLKVNRRKEVAQKIKEALKYVDYHNIRLKKHMLIFQKSGMELDLGGIAKGYIADQIREYLTENGVTGAVIDLGGNILCIGGKNKGDDFRIGIRQPFADREETVAVVDINGKSVVSSGIY